MKKTITEAGKDYAVISRVLWYVLLANLAITIVKIAIGIVTNALSVTADGFHSLVDTSSNLIGLAATWYTASSAAALQNSRSPV